MIRHPLFASAAALAFFTISGTAMGQDKPTPVSASVAQPADDACRTVAGAKFAQWRQDRIMVRETRTFADGSKKQVEAIFTPSNAYGHQVGKPWLSMNISIFTRSVQPPAILEKSMGLADCQTAGKSSQTGGTASIISFGYVPTRYFTNASGKIWISDATGLPVHQEYRQDGNTGPQIAVLVTSDFSYDDDVVVPTDAVRSDELRRLLNNDLWMHLANGGGGGRK